MVELINSFPDFKGVFGDKRIDKRAAQALQTPLAQLAQIVMTSPKLTDGHLDNK